MILKKRTKGYYFNDILNLWLETKKEVKIQSRQKYENLIKNYLNNNIGNILIKKIKVEDINSFFKYLHDNDVSISIQKTLLYIIKSAFKLAQQKKYCNYIDLGSLKLKQPTKKVNVLTKIEQLKLEEVLKNKPNIRKVCLLLCLYTGLRIGEVCGLKWEDINLENQSLNVKRTIQRIKSTDSNIDTKTILIESTPKSNTSIRSIPIPNFLIDMLKKYQGDKNYYILSESTKMYDPRTFRTFFKRILVKANIGYTNFHTLRHTFATRSIESKMDIKTLSEILGHSNVNITLSLYVHPSHELKKLSIEHLVEFMNV